MIGSVLVVCTGNICRSPVGERLLAQACPNLRVASAGLGAVVGAAADPTTAEVAENLLGLTLSGHVARSFTLELGQQYDLILVMDHHHKSDMMRAWPQLSGRIMLFDHWVGGKGIDDPYRRASSENVRILAEIGRAAEAWASRLTHRVRI